MISCDDDVEDAFSARRSWHDVESQRLLGTMSQKFILYSSCAWGSTSRWIFIMMKLFNGLGNCHKFVNSNIKHKLSGCHNSDRTLWLTVADESQLHQRVNSRVAVSVIVTRTYWRLSITEYKTRAKRWVWYSTNTSPTHIFSNHIFTINNMSDNHTKSDKLFYLMKVRESRYDTLLESILISLSYSIAAPITTFPKHLLSRIPKFNRY